MNKMYQIDQDLKENIASIEENPNNTSRIKMDDGETFDVYNSIKTIEKLLEEDNNK